MYKHILYFLPILLLCFDAHAATTCSRANLTKCLDSACAINMSANPAARCQYCGTADAGTPSVPKGMRSVNVGSSAKYNISDKDLKVAPTDPGERYAWATKQCISRVSGCTPDDVSETYDKLIEQSCTAAGITAQMQKLQENIVKTKSKSECESTITACVIDNTKCQADWRKCDSDTTFDKFFSECAIQSVGCDEHVSALRTTLIATRDTAIKNADTALKKIVATYADARAKKTKQIISGCQDNSTYNNCISTVCENNMPHKCADDFESEKSAAANLCKFYQSACTTLD